jgi:hypothetical protein
VTEYSTSERFCAGAAREVAGAAGDVRTALLQAIRSLGFATTREQFGFIEAERGSKLPGLIMSRTRVPAATRYWDGAARTPHVAENA